MSKIIKIVLAIVLCISLTALTTTDAATACQTVAQNMEPCRNYLKNGGAVPSGCCNGVRSLQKSASTTAVKRAYCECMKSQAKANGISSNYASSLAGKCNVKIPYQVSLKTNCNSIQ